jgi:hypothetical protein
MKPELIETYTHSEEGYNPFFIRDNWQVAQLNYMPAQDLKGITKMDMHLLTDEVFVLTKGTAVLIAAAERENGFSFQCIRMRPGVTYNIPVKVWHNIAMDKDASVIIVEKSNTHLGDFTGKPLSEEERVELNRCIEYALEG